MKKIVFNKSMDEVTGSEKLIASVKEVGALSEDGSSVKINYSLLEKAFEVGLFERKGFARGYSNIFYKCGNITFLRIKDDEVIVMDSFIYCNEWIGDTFRKADKSVCLSRKERSGLSRAYSKVVMENVKHLNRDGNEVISEKHKVTLAEILWDIRLGNIKGLTAVEGVVYSIVGMDLHHEKAAWDERLESTMLLTKEEHVTYHQVNGKGSHQIAVRVNTLDELQAFIEYLRNN